MNIGDAIKSAVHGVPAMVTGGEPGYRAGEEKLAWAMEGLRAGEGIRVMSGAFGEGEAMPTKHSADGEQVSPPVSWTGVPAEARSVAVVVEDPDAPTPEPFVHWLVYNLPTDRKGLAEGASGKLDAGMEGKNSKLKPGWTGTAPPKGERAHRYVFQVFALDTVLPLEPGVGRGELFKAMGGHVVGRGRLLGTYRR